MEVDVQMGLHVLCPTILFAGMVVDMHPLNPSSEAQYFWAVHWQRGHYIGTVHGKHPAAWMHRLKAST
jgi:hypothetical protein